MNFNFNHSRLLWTNYRETLAAMPNGGAIIVVSEDGHIGNGYEVLARCTDKAHAASILSSAGFRKIGYNQYKAR